MRNELLKIAVSALLCLGCMTAAAGAAQGRKDRSATPITVKSDALAADNKGKTAVFTGKVVAKQADITIHADKLTIRYSNSADEVEKIEAEGNVRIIQQNRTGFADHADYDSREGQITLTGGNPKVMQGPNTITGKRITYFIDEEKSIVTGGDKERVEMVIHPKQGKGNAAPR